MIDWFLRLTERFCDRLIRWRNKRLLDCVLRLDGPSALYELVDAAYLDGAVRRKGEQIKFSGIPNHVMVAINKEAIRIKRSADRVNGGVVILGGQRAVTNAEPMEHIERAKGSGR